MTKGLRHVVLAGALAVGVLAQAQARPAPAGRAPAAGAVEGKVDPRSGVGVPAEPKAFLEWLHHLHQQEIQLGQVAQDRATTREIKQLGEMLVKDHRAADDKLLAFAAQKGWTLAEPKAASDVERRMLDAGHANQAVLESLEGEAFDRSFLASLVGGHDWALARVWAAEQQYKGDVAALLKPVAGRLQEHRDQAYKLLGQARPKAS